MIKQLSYKGMFNDFDNTNHQQLKVAKFITSLKEN